MSDGLVKLEVLPRLKPDAPNVGVPRGLLKGMLDDRLKMAQRMAEIGNWGMCNAELLEAQRIIGMISNL